MFFLTYSPAFAYSYVYVEHGLFVLLLFAEPREDDPAISFFGLITLLTSNVLLVMMAYHNLIIRSSLWVSGVVADGRTDTGDTITTINNDSNNRHFVFFFFFCPSVRFSSRIYVTSPDGSRRTRPSSTSSSCTKRACTDTWADRSTAS